MAVLSFVQLADLWKSAGGDPLQAETAAAIALAESGGDTNRVNNTAYPNRPGYHPPVAGAQKEYSVGLWQINLLAHPTYTATQMLTQAGNVAAARAISGNGANWNPWSTYTSGAYKKFLLTVVPPMPTTTPAPATGLSKSAQHSLSGWHKLSTTLGGTIQQSLAQSAKSRQAALRALR